MKIHRVPTTLCLLALASSFALHAGEPESIAPPVYTTAPEDSWEFSIAPYGWIAGLEGAVGIGPVSADVDLSFGDILDNLDVGAMLMLEARKGRWSFQLDSLWLKLATDNKTSGPLITRAKVDVEEIRLAPMVGYRVQEGVTNLDLLVGFQYFSLDTDLAITGALDAVTKASSSEDWVDPMIGFRVQHQFSDHWSLLGRGDIGGFGVGSELTWQAFAALGYSWKPNATLYVGYRHLDIDYDSDGFLYDTTTSGPVIGASWTF